MGDIVHPTSSEVLYQRSRDGPLPSNPKFAIECLLQGISLEWQPGPLKCINVSSVTDGSDLEGTRGLAKLSPGTVVEGVSKRIVEHNGDSIVRYKVKFMQYSEMESGWVSRDTVMFPSTNASTQSGSRDVTEEDCLAFSCLEAKLNSSNETSQLSMASKQDILKQLSFAVILHAPLSSVQTWLDTLCCYEEIQPSVPAAVTSSSTVEDPWSSVLKNSRGGGVCGYLFKRGDMAWNCKTCQSDATCVQCDACFRRSDHTGHDVFFHATAPGGCCDCGDIEAWADAGCCDKHRQKTEDSVEDVLPAHIVNNTTDAIQNVLNFILEVRRRTVKGFESPPEENHHSNNTSGANNTQAGSAGMMGGGMQAFVNAFRPRVLAQFLSGNSNNSSSSDGESSGMPSSISSSSGNVSSANASSRASSQAISSSSSIGLESERDSSCADSGVLHELEADDDSSMRDDGNQDETTSDISLNSRDMFGDIFGVGNVWNRSSQQTQVQNDSLNSSSSSSESDRQFLEPSSTPPSIDNHDILVRVFNDDVHTYDEVISCLTEQPFAQSPQIAQKMTVMIDKEGEADMMKNASLPNARMLIDKFQSHGLLVCATSQQHLKAEARMNVCLEWITSLTTKSSSLRALVGQLLSSPVPSTREGGPPLWLLQNHLSIPILEFETKSAESYSNRTSSQPLNSGGGEGGGGGGMVRSVIVVAAPKSSKEAAPNGPDKMCFNSSYVLLLLLSDFFSSEKTRESCHALWLSLLADQEFKQAFGDSYFIALPQLCQLFGMGVGCSEDSVFDLNVQLFTTPSLIKRQNESQFLNDFSKHHNEFKHLLSPTQDQGNHSLLAKTHVLPGLIDTLLLCLFDMFKGNKYEINQSDPEELSMCDLDDSNYSMKLEGRMFRHSRYSSLISGLHYALKSPGAAAYLCSRVAINNTSDDGSADDVGPESSSSYNDFSSGLSSLLRVTHILQEVDPMSRIKEGQPHVEMESQLWISAWNFSLPLVDVINLAIRDATLTSHSQSISLQETTTTGGGGGGGGERVRGRCSLLMSSLIRSVDFLYQNYLNKGRSFRLTLNMTPEQANSYAIIDFMNKAADGLTQDDEPFRCALYDTLKDKVFLHTFLQRIIGSMFFKAMELPLNIVTTSHVVPYDRSGQKKPSSIFSFFTEMLCRVVGCENSRSVRMTLGMLMCEAPMRLSAFMVHAYSGLWARNGNGPMNQAMNYRNIPFCYNFRDLDLSALSLSALFLGPEYFMKLALVRFNILKWVKIEFQSDNFGMVDVEGDLKSSYSNPVVFQKEGKDDSNGYSKERNDVQVLSKFFNEYKDDVEISWVEEEVFPHVLSELLLLCVNLITEVPLVPHQEVMMHSETSKEDTFGSTNSQETMPSSSSSPCLFPSASSDVYLHVLTLKIRRALIHAVSNAGSSGLKHSKVNDIVHKISGEDETRIDVNKILSQICIQDASKSKLLKLKDEVAVGEFDPSFASMYYLREYEQTCEYISTLRTNHYKKIISVPSSTNASSATSSIEEIPIVGKAHCKTNLEIDQLRFKFLLSTPTLQLLMKISLKRRLGFMNSVHIDQLNKEINTRNSLGLKRRQKLLKPDGDRACCNTLHLLTMAFHMIETFQSEEKKSRVKNSQTDTTTTNDDGKSSDTTANFSATIDDTSSSDSTNIAFQSDTCLLHPTIDRLKNNKYKNTLVKKFFTWLRGDYVLDDVEKYADDAEPTFDYPLTMTDDDDNDSLNQKVVVNTQSPLWLLSMLWLECHHDKSAFPVLHRMGLNWLLAKADQLDPYHKCGKILAEFAIRNEKVPIPGAYVDPKRAAASSAAASAVAVSSDSSPSSAAAGSMAERRKAAQQRAMEAMKKSQAAFSKHMQLQDEGAMDKENEGELDKDGGGAGGDNGDDGQVQCVICRSSGTGQGEGSNTGSSALAYIGFAQRSSLLATSITQANLCQECTSDETLESGGGGEMPLDNRWPKKSEVFVVVSPTGCTLEEDEKMDSSPLLFLPKGSLLGQLLQVKGNRAQVSVQLFSSTDAASSKPQIKQKELENSNGGDDKTDEEESNSKTNGESVTGWLSFRTSKGRQLISALRHQHGWQRWGKSRLHLSSCGHAVHLPCWDAHFARVISTPSRGEFESAFHDRREFHCPLCRSLSNILIPSYEPLESLETYQNRHLIHTSSSSAMTDDVDVSSTASDGVSAEVSEQQNKNKMAKLDELSNLLEWKRSNGIYFKDTSLGIQYSTGERLQVDKILNPKPNDDGIVSIDAQEVVFNLQESSNSHFMGENNVLSNDDCHSMHIFTDMLCEAAINMDEKVPPISQLPQFQAHQAYASLAYTLQCLEVATREAFQFPKSGQGCDANSLISYASLLQRLSRSLEVHGFTSKLRERLNGNIKPMFFKLDPLPLTPQGCGGTAWNENDDENSKKKKNQSNDVFNKEEEGSNATQSSFKKSKFDVLIHSQYAVTEDGHRGVSGGVGGAVGFSLAGDGFPSLANELTRQTRLQQVVKAFKNDNIKEDMDNSSEMNDESSKKNDESDLVDVSAILHCEGLKWSCWMQPVLSWDLSTLSVALLTSCTPPCLSSEYIVSSPYLGKQTEQLGSGGGNDGRGLPLSTNLTFSTFLKHDRAQLLKVLTLLKVSQILLEPGLRLVSPASSNTNFSSSISSDPIALLRKKLCDLTENEIDENAPSGYQLLTALSEKLTPFLIFILCLDKLLTPLPKSVSTSNLNKKDMNSERLWEVLSLDRDDLESLLLAVGLPSNIETICSNQDLFDVFFEPWAKQFHSFYQPGTMDRKEGDKSESFDLISSRKCGWCGKVERCLRCTGCFDSQYCSRECQKAHWGKGHRTICAALSGTGIKTAGWGGSNYLSSLSGSYHPVLVAGKSTNRSNSGDAGSSGGGGGSNSNISFELLQATQSKNRKLNNKHHALVHDYSHFSMSMNIYPKLFKLPNNYHDVYTLVSPFLDQLAYDAHGGKTGGAEQKEPPEAAICLITGTILPAGSKLDPTRPSIGALTMHASISCNGAGLFFLVRKCSLIAIRGEHAAVLPTPYLDQWGEEDVGFRRGRPLYLDQTRWDSIMNMYMYHRIAHQVSAVRSSKDTVIRSSYY